MKKFISVFFAVLMIASAAFVSGCEPKLPSGTEDGGSETDTVSAEDTRTPDHLPEVNYGGKVFRVITTASGSERDIFTEDHPTSDPLHDAVLLRNQNVCERFGITLDVTVDEYTNVPKRVSTAVKSGADEYDMCNVHMVKGASLAQNNDVLPFEKLPYVDFTMPWWDKDIANGFSIRNNLMMANGDISPTSFSYTSCLFFNKRMFDSLDLPYPYQLVRDGKWTLDKLIELTKDISRDMDGDGKIKRESDADVFGITSYFLSVPYDFYYGAGGMLVSKDQDDVPFFDPQVERDTAIYQKIYDALITNNANFETEEAYELNVIKIFTDGRAMFYNASLGSAEFLREMDDEFGILPEPMFDENQKEYKSFVNGASSMICVPATVKSENLEYVSIIIEALASEAYEVITPVLTETYLKRKLTRDYESMDMIDYIVRHRVFDMAYVNLWEGAGSYVRDLLRQKSTNVASKLKSVTTQSKRKIENIVKAFDKSLNS